MDIIRVAMYGRETALGKVRPGLTDHRIEALDLSPWAHNPLFLELFETADVALIDAHGNSAAPMCAYVQNAAGVPVLLLVEPAIADWSHLATLHGSGYIMDTAAPDEVTARISAMARRASSRRLP